MFDVRVLFAALRRPRPVTAFERGTHHLAAGRHAAALREFETASETAAAPAERAALANKRGVALVGLGRRPEALDAFCAAIAEDGGSAAALVNVGNFLFEDGHVLDALDYYEGAIRLDERCAFAYRNLSAALRRLGRRAEAVRALKTAVRLEGPPSRARA